MNKKKRIYAGLIKPHNLSMYNKYKCNEGIQKTHLCWFKKNTQPIYVYTINTNAMNE